MRSERSLFRRLQTLSASTERDQTEDFFSEALVGLFEHQPAICREWLNSLRVDLTIPDEAELTFATQVRYPELETTSHPRRPDIRIRIECPDGSRSVVLVESKHLASEGSNQLRDYAHILAGERYRNAEYRLPLYVTTRYEVKNKSDVLGPDIEDGVEFYHARWHDLYRFLLARSGRPVENYYQENILRFMEELGMATANQLHPTDLVALQRLPDSVALMKEVLGSVERRFRSILSHQGGRPPRTDELGTRSRYSLRHSTTQLQVLLGFFLDRGQDYPTLGLMLEVRNPSHPNIFEHLRDIRNQEDWAGKDLGMESRWSGVVVESSLRSFLSAEDHVSEMKQYCSKLLTELEAIQDRYPMWFDATDTELEDDEATEDLT